MDTIKQKVTLHALLSESELALIDPLMDHITMIDTILMRVKQKVENDKQLIEEKLTI